MPSSERPRDGLTRRSAIATLTGVAVAGAVPTTAGADHSRAAFEPTAFLPLEGTMDAITGPAGETVYVAATDGFAVVDASDPTDPTVLAERSGLAADQPDGPMQEIWDLGHTGDRLVAAGPGFGGPGFPGIVVFDVSDPADPTRTGVYETDYAIHNVGCANGRAYLTDREHAGAPVRIVDLATLELVGEFTPARYGVPARKVHDVYLDGDRLYACYWDRGTWIVDVRDPRDPQPLGWVGFDRSAAPNTARMELPGNAHYAQPHPERPILAVGKEAFEDDGTSVDGAPGGIDLWDLSGKPSRECVIAPPDDATAHNFGWRGDRLYVAWYGDGIAVYEVRDAARPTFLARWTEPPVTLFTAKPLASGCVVSNWRGTDEPGLYCLPEPTDDDARPAETMEPLAPPAFDTDPTPTASPAPTASPTPTPSSTPTAGSTPPPSSTPTGSATPTSPPSAATGTQGVDDRSDATSKATTTDAPGLGTLSTLAAGSLAGWRLTKSRDDEKPNT